MISIIVCSTKPVITNKLNKNIEDTIGNIPYEIVWIDNSTNKYTIFSAYNEGVGRAKGDLLCFMHEDIFFHSKQWGERVYEHFQDPNVGMLGVVGGKILPAIPYITLWDGIGTGYFMQGHALKKRYKTELVLTEDLKCNRSVRVVAVDGLWFCIPAALMKDMSFDSDTFKGFHCYDLDICMQVLEHQKNILVINDVLIEHVSPGTKSSIFYDSLFLWYDKWKSFLPQYTLDEETAKEYLYKHQSLKDYYIEKVDLLDKSNASLFELKNKYIFTVLHFIRKLFFF